jgi:hypothetical protein
MCKLGTQRTLYLDDQGPRKERGAGLLELDRTRDRDQTGDQRDGASARAPHGAALSLGCDLLGQFIDKRVDYRSDGKCDVAVVDHGNCVLACA